MRIFPYKKYIIETDMPKNTALDRLLQHTIIKGEFKLAESDKYFKGTVTENSFDLILRMISLVYSHPYYRPQIKGNIVQESDMTKVSFSVKTTGITKFISWMPAAIFLGAAIIMYEDTELLFTLLGFGVFVFAINLGSVYLFFKSYVKKCMKYMEMIFRDEATQQYKTYEDLEDDYRGE